MIGILSTIVYHYSVKVTSKSFSAVKQPKVNEYRPPDFNETFGYPPDYAESTGIFECDSEGKSFLDSVNDVNASFLGSHSMFGSSVLNSRNDMRNGVSDTFVY